MISEHIKSALRNIFRKKAFGIVSVFGLGVGIAIATMVGLFLRYENSFDTMHPDHENTYRLNWVNVGTGAHFATYGREDRGNRGCDPNRSWGRAGFCRRQQHL